MALLEFSIVPLGKGEGVSEYVARSLKVIDESGLDYRLTAMGTIIEGDVDQVFDVVKQCVDTLAVDCDRVTCSMSLDYRKGYTNRLESKVKRVEERLGRALRHA